MLKLKWKKRSFTLVEVIVVCSMFAVIVVGMLFGISRAFVFLNGIRLQVIATNFAREGVEMMYNLRDTNRRKYPSNRDGYCFFTNDVDGDELRFQNQMYVLVETGFGGEISIGIDHGNSKVNCYEVKDFFTNTECESLRNGSKITFTGTYKYYSEGEIITGDMEDLMGGLGVEFYRLVRVYGYYKKDANNPNDEIPVSNGKDDNIRDGTPKEMRFCVKVFFTDNRSRHEKELCSIMTNFLK